MTASSLLTPSVSTVLKIMIAKELTSLTLRVEALKRVNDNFVNDLSSGIEAVLSIHNIYDKSDIEGKQRVIGSIFQRKFIFE